MNKLNFNIIYEDNSYFDGDSLNKDWNKAPDKLIKEVIYTLNEKQIKFSGYKEYNHLVEKVSIIKKGSYISKLLFIGRNKDISDIIIINFKDKVITKQTVKKGQEYNNQKLTGWKKGSINSEKGRITYGGF